MRNEKECRESSCQLDHERLRRLVLRGDGDSDAARAVVHPSRRPHPHGEELGRERHSTVIVDLRDDDNDAAAACFSLDWSLKKAESTHLAFRDVAVSLGNAVKTTAAGRGG